MEFVLVSVLVVVLFLMVVQVALVLHCRNVLVASAAEGARYAADADASPHEGELRAQQAVAAALSRTSAGRMRYQARLERLAPGATAVEITISGPLPLVFGPVGPLSITVHGHALREGP